MEIKANGGKGRILMKNAGELLLDKRRGKVDKAELSMELRSRATTPVMDATFEAVRLKVSINLCPVNRPG